MEYQFDPNVRYAKSHEWVRVEGAEAIVGISDYAQHSLSDIVFIELPEIGRKVQQGQPCAVIESVKAAEDIYAPLSGEVIAINAVLEHTPETVNQDPFGEGWLFRLRMDNPAELDSLLDVEAYQALVESEDQ